MQSLTKNSTTRLIFIALIGIILAGIYAQNYTHDPSRASETRPLSADVSIVKLSGSIDLKIKQGHAPQMIVQTDKSRLPRIITEQNGDTLHIKPKGNWLINWLRSMIFSEGPATVELTMPALQGLTLQGGGDAIVGGFSGDLMRLDVIGSGDIKFNSQYKKVDANIHGSGNIQFDRCVSDEMNVNITGSGKILAAGQSASLTINMTGSGDLDTKQLIVDTAKVVITGSGNANIFVKQAIDLSLTGSSNVRVYGKPARHNVQNVGANNVNFD